MLHQTAPTTHPLIAVDAIRESAAQLLFMNVNFLKNLTPFTQLPLSDQLLLFEESWREFFIMGIAEHLLPINFTQLLFAYEFLNTACHEPKSKISTETMIREIEAFQEILNKFIQMRVDSNEYVYLRAIVLYKSDLNNNNNNNNNNSQDIITSTSDDSSSDLSHNNSTATIKTSSSALSKSLDESSKVKALECNARDALAAYEQNYYGVAHQIRYKNLLALLPSLKLVSHCTIEELFFRRNIGHVPLLKLLVDLYMQKKAWDIWWNEIDLVKKATTNICWNHWLKVLRALKGEREKNRNRRKTIKKDEIVIYMISWAIGCTVGFELLETLTR